MKILSHDATGLEVNVIDTYKVHSVRADVTMDSPNHAVHADLLNRRWTTLRFQVKSTS